MKKILLSLLLVQGLVCANLESELFQKANSAFSKGEWAEASKTYRDVIKQKGTYLAFAWFNLGQCLVHQEKLPLAAIAYKRAIEVAPEFTRPYRALGDVHFQLHAAPEAMKYYRRALEATPDDASLFLNLGETALMGGDPVEAIRWFDQYRKIDPYDSRVYLAMADAYQRAKDWESACDILERAIQFSAQKGGRTYFALADMRRRAGQEDLALKAQEEGLLFEPTQVMQRRNLAQNYKFLGKSWLALATLEEGLRIEPQQMDLLVDAGAMYFEQKRFDEAQDRFLRAAKLGSSSGKIGLRNIAKTYRNAARIEEAQKIEALLSQMP